MKFLSRMFTPPKPKTPAVTPPPPDPAIAQERQLLAESAARLDQQRADFSAAQNSALETLSRQIEAANNRPAAPVASGPQGSLTGGAPQFSSAGSEEEDPTVDANRRGRRALRIDLQGPSGASGSGGLNVPRG